MPRQFMTSTLASIVREKSVRYLFPRSAPKGALQKRYRTHFSGSLLSCMMATFQVMTIGVASAQNTIRSPFDRAPSGIAPRPGNATEMPLLGTVIPLEYADVSSPRDGVIDQLPVQLGQSIRQSDLVATLQNEEIKRRLRKAEAERDAAKARATNVFLVKSIEVELRGRQRRLDRTLVLLKNKNAAAYVPVTTSEIDQLRATVEKLEMDAASQRQQQREAEAQYLAAQREVEVIEYELERSIATSPIDGLVSEIHHQRGEFTRSGEKMVTVMRVDRMQLQLEIRIAGLRDRSNGTADGLPTLAALIGRPLTANIEALGSGTEPMVIEGKIDRIAPEIFSGPSVRAYVEFDNESTQAGTAGETIWRSLPGQLATVTLLPIEEPEMNSLPQPSP